MSLFDENIIKKDLSVESILQQNVYDVVTTAYHDIQYRINNGQTLFKLHPNALANEHGCFDVGTTGNYLTAFKDVISWGLYGLKERLDICPINWNDAKLNLDAVRAAILPSNEKIDVSVWVDYKIFKPKRFIGEPSILDMGGISYMYTFEEFEIPLDRPSPSFRFFV